MRLAIQLSSSCIVFIALIIANPVLADNASRDQEIEQRFAMCDKNHDGKLTKEEAKGCMPRIYDHFDYIDSAGNGYVTVTQIIAIANN